jgi:hypothetical protein
VRPMCVFLGACVCPGMFVRVRVCALVYGMSVRLVQAPECALLSACKRECAFVYASGYVRLCMYVCIRVCMCVCHTHKQCFFMAGLGLR